MKKHYFFNSNPTKSSPQRNRILSIMLGFTMIFMTGAFSYGQVYVGSGTTTTFFLPIQTNFNFNYTQQIYSKQILETAIGSSNPVYITSIGFYYTGKSNGTDVSSTANFDNWTIYMGNTSKSSFSSKTDWMPISQFSQNFSGAITFPTAGNWVEIVLDTPFYWDGTSNIALTIHEQVPGSGDQTFWRTFPTTGTTSIRYGSTSTNPNPSAPSVTAWTIDSFNSQLKLAVTPNLSVNDSKNDILKIYPNPVKDVVRFSVGEKISAVQIYDAQGKVLISKEVNNKKETSVDLSGIPSGIYFAKITANGSAKIMKVIKQ